MKKLLAFILAAVMAFSMVACGGGETNEGGEVSGEGTTDSQPVGKVESNYDITKLSTFGLPEPSFDYSYEYYEEVNKREQNGDIISTNPKYIFSYNADNTTAYAYMEEVLNVGWGGELPRLDETNFRYNPENENYQINISWGSDDNNCYIYVRDFTKNCVYDEDAGIYVIEELGEYGTYGKYIYG